LNSHLVAPLVCASQPRKANNDYDSYYHKVNKKNRLFSYTYFKTRQTTGGINAAGFWALNLENF
tara:strand:- start:450 stop:641 length:192 start_codon:yes stop_codon:yes gene_type:complete